MCVCIQQNNVHTPFSVHVWMTFVELMFWVCRDAPLRFPLFLPAFDGGLPERVRSVFMSPRCSLFMAGVSLCVSGRVRIVRLRKREVGDCNGMYWWWFQGAVGVLRPRTLYRQTQIKGFHRA